MPTKEEAKEQEQEQQEQPEEEEALGEQPEGEDAPELEKTRVKKAVLQKAIKALLQLVAKQKAGQPLSLFDDGSQPMMLLFNNAYIPVKRREKPFVLPLVHSIYGENVEVCFICKDPQKQYKELLLETYKVPQIKKVISLSKLKKEYTQIKQKEELADSYDLFLIDFNIWRDAVAVLGNMFFKKKVKVPLPIRFDMCNPLKSIERAIRSVPYNLPTGPSTSVKIGRCNMTEEQLMENAIALLPQVVSLSHRFHNPIMSINLQARNTMALPIWRRAQPLPGQYFKTRTRRNGSSSASDAGTGISDSEATGDSVVPSDAGETLSTRDSISDLETSGELTSDVDTLSEIGSSTADDDDVSVSKERLPLVHGLKAKKRRRAGIVDEEELAAEPEAPVESAAAGKKGGKKAAAKGAEVTEAKGKKAEEGAAASMGPPAPKKVKKA